MTSMFIGTTIDKPNVESIINAVATILHSQMLEVIIIKKLTLSRIKVKEEASKTNLSCSSSQRKSTSRKNPKLSTSIGSRS